MRNIVANLSVSGISIYAGLFRLLLEGRCQQKQQEGEQRMQLGVFTRDADGVLTGSIRTLSATVDQVDIVPTSKRSPASPDFRVYGPTGSDFGAGWNKISQDGKAYVSLVLRDPAFNNGLPLYPILVEGEAGQFVMAWEAPDPSRAPTRPTVTPDQARAADRADAPAPSRRTKA